MPYKEHRNLIPPKDEKTKIWRYIDFTKFVSLLDRSALFFIRVDKLTDPFEGSYSKANIMLRPKAYGVTENELKGLDELNKQARKQWAVSCWHLNDHESIAMWRLYLRDANGIAIQSTFNRLKECFLKATQDIYVGEMRYIDYASVDLKDAMGWGNVLVGLMHKHKSFEHERELRALVQVPLQNGEPLLDEGLYVSVDLNTLIDTIRIAPSSPEWINDLVKSVVKKYGLSIEVFQSALDSEPLY